MWRRGIRLRSREVLILAAVVVSLTASTVVALTLNDRDVSLVAQDNGRDQSPGGGPQPMSAPPSGFFGDVQCSETWISRTHTDFPTSVDATPLAAWEAAKAETEPYLIIPSSALTLNYVETGNKAQLGYFEPLTNRPLMLVNLTWDTPIGGGAPGWYVSSSATCSTLTSDPPELNITQEEVEGGEVEPLPTVT